MQIQKISIEFSLDELKHIRDIIGAATGDYCKENGLSMHLNGKIYEGLVRIIGVKDND